MSANYLPPGLPQSLEVGDRIQLVDPKTGRDGGGGWFVIQATKLPWVRLQLAGGGKGGPNPSFWLNLRRYIGGWRKAEHGE